jgi:predicted enzyme related to lactoylglutathione lyase
LGDVFLPRVVHFEISAEKPEKLTKFYEQVFKWKFEKWKGPMDYWMIMTGENEPGIDGGLARRQNGVQTVNTIGVDSIDEFVKKITKNNGTVIVPKTAIPGIGWTAYFKDPEGNFFGLMEDDPSAK